MIPTMILAGLLVGLLRPLPGRFKALAALVLSAGWAVVIWATVDDSSIMAVMAFCLALANVAIGIGIGVLIAGAVHRVRTRGKRATVAAEPSEGTTSGA